MLSGNAWGAVAFHQDSFSQNGNGNFTWNGKNQLQSAFMADGDYKIILHGRDTAAGRAGEARQVAGEVLLGAPDVEAVGGARGLAWHIDLDAYFPQKLITPSENFLAPSKNMIQNHRQININRNTS